MTPYYSDALLDFYHGDVLDTLRQLPDESVQCVVTSPPYFALRDYGIDGQIGLESTPAEYVAKLVAVFDEVRRVLRSDGTCWLNLGDSYAGSGKGAWDRDDIQKEVYVPGVTGAKITGTTTPGLKPKDLCMIPARVAIALQDAGWWLRSEIVWAKKSPMPESVTDRPTSATEKIFLLTKSAKYFYDADAVKVESTMRPQNRYTNGRGDKDDGYAAHRKAPGMTNPAGRNLWNYWLLSPEPFPDAHFAVFPTAIPRTAILAGTSERGACPACGSPWRRVVERETSAPTRVGGPKTQAGIHNSSNRPGGFYPESPQTTGWQPTCDCDAGPPRPCVVLDPFLGSGTTALVAQQLGRKCIGIDLNADYLDMAVQRCAQKTIWSMTL